MRFLQYVCKMPVKADYNRKGNKIFLIPIICGEKSCKDEKETALIGSFVS